MSNLQVPNGNVTEESPLLTPEQSDTDDCSQSSTISQRIFTEEMQEPWPATFERSIMLLASPIITTKDVDFVTHSPKPGIPMGAKWRVRWVNEPLFQL